jgi:serine/threonine-protein kinase RsbT
MTWQILKLKIMNEKMNSNIMNSEIMNSEINDITFEILEPSDNAQVIYTTREMTARIGFDETQQYLIASAVSELSTNITRYATKGFVSLKIDIGIEKSYFEVTAEDQGPGIVDIAEALKDNVSSGGGLGLGLPSVKRIMDDFVIESTPGKGTRVIARKWIV